MSLILDGPFGDNMVLQRGKPVKFRGSTEPKSVVRVQLGDSVKEDCADDEGRWEIVFSALSAGGPYNVRASSGDEEILFQNVLIGEVWICSGQSNMEWTVGISPDADQVIPEAELPLIRLLKVPRVAHPEPQHFEARWQVCSPATIGDFSKVAYHHGRELLRALNVPIGLIDAAWGGTVLEAWTPRDVLLGDREMAPQVAGYEATLTRHAEIAAEYKEKMKHWSPPPDPGNTKFDAGWIEVPPELAGRELRLHLGTCDKADTTYFNNEEVGSISLEFPGSWREPRNYRIPGRLVRGGRNTLAVRVFSNINNSGMTGPRDAMWLETEGWSAPLAGPWQFRVEHNLGWTTRPASPWGVGNPNSPYILFNSMISPLRALGIRGVIWYQGESNEATPVRYARLFPAMIRGWRKAWEQGDFPFLFVQLPTFGPGESSISHWSEIRHAQERGLTEPATAMVPTIDIGDPNDPHPPNKVEVGRRLAFAALATAYHHSDPSLMSPRIESVLFRGGEVRLRFAPVDCGLVTRKGSVQGFAVAEDDHFVPAEAYIEGPEIIVRSNLVSAPRAVRYAYTDHPAPNLVNQRGLPLPPVRFRTGASESENSLLGSAD